MIKYLKSILKECDKMAHYPRIRDLREDCDKKQYEIAEYLGTTKQYYSLYEKGANEISFERAIALAKYYDVSLDYIAGLTNNKKGLSHGELSDEQRELLQLSESLSANEKNAVVNFLKTLLGAIK